MRAIVAVLIVLVVAAGAWALVGAESSPALAGPGAPPPVAAPDRASDAARERGTGADEAPLAVRSADAERHAVAPDLEGRPWNVRVVAAATGEPIGGARVLFIPPSFDYASVPDEVRDLAATSRKAWFERVGAELLTDHAGRCDVPLGERGTQFAASRGELFGTGYRAADAEEPTVLALRPDSTMVIRVVGAGGRPVPHATVVAAVEPEGPRVRTWQMGSTDESGRLTIRHVQLHCSDGVPNRRRLSARTSGCATAAVEVDFAAPPPEVVLHLPVAGSVTVHVRDADDQPLDPRYLGQPEVRLATLDGKPENLRQKGDAFNTDRMTAPIGPGGAAVFSHVGLDRYVVAQVGFSRDLEIEAVGPTHAEPHVDLVIRESESDTILVGRVLARDGSPLPDTGVMITGRYRNGMGSRSARTDDTGRFRCNVGSWFQNKECTLTVATSPFPRRNAADLATVLAPKTLAAGTVDLGDVTLAPLAVILAGRVVPGPGVEARTAHLRIEASYHGRWSQEWSLRPEWQPDGTFEVKGAVPAGTPLRLEVQKGAYMPVEPIECAAGATGIEIPLNVAGSASATFLVAEDTPLAQLSAYFRSEGGEPSERDRMMESVRARLHPGFGIGLREDGRMTREWSGLEPGSYRLTVVVAGEPEPLVEIAGIEVGGGECEDPRLVDIDLRGLLRTVEIRVRKPDGTPLEDRDAFVVVRTTNVQWEGFNLAHGVVEIATPDAVDALVVAPGYATAELVAVARSHTVTLEPAPRVTLEVEIGAELPADTALQLRLVAELGHSRRARITCDTGRGMMLDNFFVEEAIVVDGKVEVPVRWPGRYRIEARLGRYSLRGAKPGELTLPGGATRLVFDAATVERTLERMRR